MSLFLQNPTNQAHLEDLRTRLVVQLGQGAVAKRDRLSTHLTVERLVEVVRAMDVGALSPKDALEVFAQHRVPGFSFGRWLIEMMDEGVYLEELFNEAA